MLQQTIDSRPFNPTLWLNASGKKGIIRTKRLSNWDKETKKVNHHAGQQMATCCLCTERPAP